MNVSYLTRSNCGTLANRYWLLFAGLATSLIFCGSASAQPTRSSIESSGQPSIGPAFHPSVPVFGGITQADFQPLIDLIQNTVHNESWLGTGQGLGTIQAFPSGVLVDTSGLLKKIELLSDSKSFDLRANTTTFRLSHNQKKTTNLRKVSLTRLQRAAESRAAQGLPPDLAMQNLAGLTNIQYLIAIPESGEIIIAGEGGAWQYDELGQPLSIVNGSPVLQLDDFVVSLRNAIDQHGKFGCSITPRQQNLAATQNFLATSKLKAKQWSEKLRETLGRQDIEVFGINEQTHAARVLVEADYHMKRIGMGLEPSIPAVPGFLERIELLPDGSVPPMDVVRWWFTLNYESVQSDPSRCVFAFTGNGVKVLSENELLDQQGNRIHTGKTHGPAKSFAEDFTRHYTKLADKYPVYRKLKNVFDLAMVAGLIQEAELARKTGTEWNYFATNEPQSVALEEVSSSVRAASYLPRLAPAAKEVDTIMNERIIKVRQPQSTLVHTILGVSGGVQVDFAGVVATEKIQDATAEELAPARFRDVPADPNRWWWD